MPAPRSSSRPIPGQGGKQHQPRPKRRACQQDFSEYEQYTPLNELPVLTKQGVGCSLRDYMEGRHHGRTEHHDAVASSSPGQSTSADLPPPYVERIENDPVAIKASPAPSDREGAAKENQSIGNIDRNLLRPVLMQLLATARSRQGSVTPRTATPSRPSTPVPSVR